MFVNSSQLSAGADTDAADADDHTPPPPPSADELAATDTSVGASGERLGRIQFSLSYDFLRSILTLKIVRAVDLAAKDLSGTSDPYVKVMLLPDKKRKLQTNIKRRNLNPRWNEVFSFEGLNV